MNIVESLICGKAFAHNGTDDESPMSSHKGENVEYRLEVYPRGNCDQDDCIKMFTSTAPFPPFHIDDLLDASAWKAEGPKRLRIVSVEHAIVEKPALGIDPSGGIINRTLIHTEAA